MKATLSLEYSQKYGGGWVALIDGNTRQYLKPKKDFSFANAKGDGTKFWYILESGRIYEINGVLRDIPEHIFLKVTDDGEIERCLKEKTSE